MHHFVFMCQSLGLSPSAPRTRQGVGGWVAVVLVFFGEIPWECPCAQMNCHCTTPPNDMKNGEQLRTELPRHRSIGWRRRSSYLLGHPSRKGDLFALNPATRTLSDHPSTTPLQITKCLHHVLHWKFEQRTSPTLCDRCQMFA
jgi:hypothetical protein